MATIQDVIPSPIMTHLTSPVELLPTLLCLLSLIFAVLAFIKKTRVAANGWEESTVAIWIYLAAATGCVLSAALLGKAA